MGPNSAIQASVVLGLEEVKKAGLDVPLLEEGRARLAGLRGKNGIYPYALNWPLPEDDLPDTMGRTPIADLALYRGGALPKEDLARSLDLYLDHWAEAWDARGKGHRAEPETDYFLFTRWYAMQIARETGRLDDERVCVIRGQLLEHQDADGSWLDGSEKTGRHAGTALGILALLASRR